MKKIFFILSMIIIFALPAFAGELYSCKDRAGNTIVTSTPQDDMTDCALKDENEDPTPVVKTKEPKEMKQQSEVHRIAALSKCEYNCEVESDPCKKSCYNSWKSDTKRWTDCQSSCNTTTRQCKTDCRNTYKSN